MLSNTGSRYIYDLYYEKEAISKQLYDWLLKNKYADANLIAKWKKQGYEKVSCKSIALNISYPSKGGIELTCIFPVTAVLPPLHSNQGDQL